MLKEKYSFYIFTIITVLLLLQGCGTKHPVKKINSTTSVNSYSVEGLQYTVRSMSFNANSRILAVGGYRTIELWDVNKQKILKTLNRNEYEAFYVNALVFNQKYPNLLAATSFDNIIKIWNTETGELLNTIGDNSKENQLTAPWHKDHISSLEFSPNGKILASGSWDTTVKLWDIDTNQHLATLKIFDDENNDKNPHKYKSALVTSISFNPDSDSNLLAVGYSNGNIYIWNTKYQQIVYAIEDAHRGAIKKVLFSKNGKILASASEDKTIKLWKFNDIKPLLLRSLTYHHATVSDLAFSNDDKLLFSSSYDKTIKIWNIKKSLLIDTLMGHEDYINTIQLNTNNRILASGSSNNIIKFWDLTLLRLTPTQQKYYLSLNSKQQDTFYGLSDNNLKTLFSLGKKEQNELWELPTKQQRINFLNTNKEKRLWQRVVRLATYDMNQVLSERFLDIDIAPTRPSVNIPAYITIPELPSIQKIKGVSNETKIQFNRRINKIKSARKKQIKNITRKYYLDVIKRNQLVAKKEKQYKKEYTKYNKELKLFINYWQQKVDAHTDKLALRHLPKNKHKREITVLKNRFYEVFGEPKIKPIKSLSDSFIPSDKTIYLIIYWGNDIDKFNKINVVVPLRNHGDRWIKRLLDALKSNKVTPLVKLDFSKKYFAIKSIKLQYNNKLIPTKIKNIKPLYNLTLKYDQNILQKSFNFAEYSKPNKYNFNLQNPKIRDFALQDLIKIEIDIFNQHSRSR